MAKGVLSMEWIPEACENCMFEEYSNGGGYNYCEVGDFKKIEELGLKPDWCPIKILPEKLKRKGEFREEENGTSYLNGIADGWNTLLDLLEEK